MTDWDLHPLTGGHRELPVMDVETAHRVMQLHIDCLTTNCRIRNQAKARLVEAGIMVPSIWVPSV
ncbi:hypothetical protein [Nocardia cyriacigeorgica]|uniref:Uncharacterized protein n=2 Tax=Nocardia cyriacigeorgica TaxID=135487 RepID=A0A4U8W517_9NOCA|nr:hypothetical protein [Nocardia cyriacigeorgica]MBF6099348.1 hypothetical protein [Nocardia cyriacigeorgica]MBF6319554.1 hypothetical protein [Nocardia cyriacigeorgica]MBF6343634.1 hypothetical protein [Nocardia cyriacigeorgica]MBF6516324.1 hypothetical protein [Nocardia cyriacigeorgica]MBF6533662.1 hypothetical protein [Nocardia cyriacigeorgica]